MVALSNSMICESLGMLVDLCYLMTIQVCPLSFSLYPVLFTAAGVSVSCAPFGGARHKHFAQRLGPFGRKI
jgi:hypothetical protein